MDYGRFDVDNTQVQLVMVIKLQQLQREQLPTLSYSSLEEYLKESKWAEHLPASLHDAVNDVMHVNANDIVRFLSREAIRQGQTAALSDFSDLIGGK